MWFNILGYGVTTGISWQENFFLNKALLIGFYHKAKAKLRQSDKNH